MLIKFHYKFINQNYIEHAFNSNIEMIYIPEKNYYLGKYPITQYQYQQIMNQTPSYFKYNPQNPVEKVSWYDAMEFCKKLSKETNKKYSLPTEEQWEYACRAGTTTEYPFGNNAKDLVEYAWYEDNSEGNTHPVGEKKSNQWGFSDMLGNVWEWCLDWCDSNDSNEETKVIRGGSWLNNPYVCRSASRYDYAPTNRSNSYGFRLARTP